MRQSKQRKGDQTEGFCQRSRGGRRSGGPWLSWKHRAFEGEAESGLSATCAWPRTSRLLLPQPLLTGWRIPKSSPVTGRRRRSLSTWCWPPPAFTISSDLRKCPWEEGRPGHRPLSR